MKLSEKALPTRVLKLEQYDPVLKDTLRFSKSNAEFIGLRKSISSKLLSNSSRPTSIAGEFGTYLKDKAKHVISNNNNKKINMCFLLYKKYRHPLYHLTPPNILAPEDLQSLSSLSLFIYCLLLMLAAISLSLFFF